MGQIDILMDKLSNKQQQQILETATKAHAYFKSKEIFCNKSGSLISPNQVRILPLFLNFLK